MLEKARKRLSLLARARVLMVALVGAAGIAACAERAYQLPAEATPAGIADRAADRPDGGLPPPQPSSRRGIIVPGDPASGMGSEGTSIETHTGTNGTRVLPGAGDGK